MDTVVTELEDDTTCTQCGDNPPAAEDQELCIDCLDSSSAEDA